MRLIQLAASLDDLLLRGADIRSCGFYRCRTRLGSSDRLIILLLRDFLFSYQLSVARQITLRLGVIGLSLKQLGFGRLILLSGAGNSCLRTGNVGLR